MPQKQKEFLEHLYPKDDKLLGREVDYLLRSASLICSTYAFHRKVLPYNAFKPVMINNVKNHMVFDKDHPKARMHREAIQAIENDLADKKIKQFTFGLCLENNPEKIVESLQFDFDYGEAAMNVKLPNATNVRVTSKWDFADDLIEVLKRVRIISVFLAALPSGIKAFVMVQYNKKPKELPKNFVYHNDYDLDNVQSLPLARFPCDTQNMAMTVEIRSKYFDVPADDIRKDVERNLDVDDVSDSSDSPPTSGRGSKKPDDHNITSYLEIVEPSPTPSPTPSDILETRRGSPNHSPDNVPERQDISDIAEERNPKSSIVEETKRSSKRSHSLEIEVIQSPPPKQIKTCQLMYYNFAPLDNFQIHSKALKGWNTDDA